MRVYLMTPRSTMKSLPLGGHYEVDVAADGTAGTVRAFTKACMEVSVTGDKRGKPAALVVSHLLDPIPTEIHVFSSLTGKISIYVMTISTDRLWRVSGTQIASLPAGAGPGK